ncbi:MAG TPA: hypothetical protein VG935_00260 [Patescibacteria group bacterium]|nr:hypothetical protein [Patescibacteria group bacterium]
MHPSRRTDVQKRVPTVKERANYGFGLGTIEVDPVGLPTGVPGLWFGLPQA